MTAPRRAALALRPLAEVLDEVTAPLPLEAGAPGIGAMVTVSALDLELPLEMRIAAGAELRASLPRGRLATGFDVPLGRLVAHFDVVAPATKGEIA